MNLLFILYRRRFIICTLDLHWMQKFL